MTHRDKERRPNLAAEAASKTFPGVTADSTDLARRARRHDYAVRVVSQRRDGVLVTAFYSNLPAAEAKVLRTRERGLMASLSLVRLVPVPFVMLDELEGGECR